MTSHQNRFAAAPVFSGAFYRGLADGLPMDAALTAGRVALFGHAPARTDWSIPVLYLAAADGILWEADAAVVVVDATTATTAEARPAASNAAPASAFQFTFQGPVTINAEVMGGNKYVTTGPNARGG